MPQSKINNCVTNYKPTWLYIKQHNQTGLKYFGKTVRDPHSYKGSGKHWKRHLKMHGDDVTTIWCQLFINKTELQEYALYFSKEHNIVESKEWANLMPENGLDGGDRFSNLPKDQQREISQKLSIASAKQQHTLERRTKAKNRMIGNTVGFKKGNLSRSGQKQSTEEIQKRCNTQRGKNPFKNKHHTDEWKENRRFILSLQPMKTCPHCHREFKPSPYTRFHGDKCKSKSK